MKTNIYLVRHALAERNLDPQTASTTDILTQEGIQQAKNVGERLKKQQIDAVYTSKIERARLTALEIGKITGKTPIILESVKERKVVYINSTEYVFQETFEELCKRLIETKTILQQLSDKHVVVVSHALFIRSFVMYLTFGDFLSEDMLQTFTNKFTVDHTTISHIMFDHEKQNWYIKSWNT